MESSGTSAKLVFDMDEHGDMKNDAEAWAEAAINTHAEEKAISKELKMKFDEKYGPTWFCILGTDFKAYVTHASKHFIFFYHGKTAICLYKC